MRLRDNRGGGVGNVCTLTLAPKPNPLISAGSRVLAGSGASGSISITATYDTFSGAFGGADGRDIVQTGSLVIPVS